jgi:hypothetical protein
VALKLIIEIPVETDNKNSCYLRIQSTRMTGLLDSENPLDPGDDFMGAGVGWLVQIDAAVLQILLQWSFEWCGSGGNRGIVIT